MYLVHGHNIDDSLLCPICSDEGKRNYHTAHWHLET
eukprot:CAMPEP_0117772776 /NCGR_PEP_ID=MMETSP0947-20121206/25331_1 /TAXON_ID=44440 /ORGANISM="Chattonella subsalsa, Strain CCMP2191" /LENGTH=35 /DNA_ID= /DNA_START= /DNA_END= /DNA_ORIENTATION=